MPKFKTFSGFGDPDNHLKSFDSQLSFWVSDDEQDVVELFMEKFGASIVVDVDERTLMEIQQKPGEALRSFATGFEEVATNIPITNEKVTMISFFHGLRYGPLKEKLVLEPPNTRNELSKLIIQYIKLEEVKLLSEEYSFKAEETKVKDEVCRKSPKRAWFGIASINLKTVSRSKDKRQCLLGEKMGDIVDPRSRHFTPHLG
ncbi:hypothetical protein LIER_25472 [Lithospermum erythrorhizon]|uniref:Retrotransposon gag domain-containing protein n=1 Tax=Lithospermum erythrorhizon TaxID=34254 RepID=A0AAV3R6F3_LITER